MTRYMPPVSTNAPPPWLLWLLFVVFLALVMAMPHPARAWGGNGHMETALQAAGSIGTGA